MSHQIRFCGSILLIMLCLMPVPASAQTNIAIGDTVTAEMQLGARDAWMFEGRAGQIIQILMSSQGFATILELYAPDGRMLMRNDNRPGDPFERVGFEAEIEPILLPETGIYTIHAIGVSIFSWREYTLSVIEAEQAKYTELAPDALITGTLQPGQDLHWVFSGAAGQEVTINVDTDLSAFNLSIGVPMQYGGLAISSLGSIFANGAKALGPVQLPTSGAYTVDLISQTETVGTYELQLILGEAPIIEESNDRRVGNCLPPQSEPELSGFITLQNAEVSSSNVDQLSTAIEDVADANLFLQRAVAYAQLADYQRALFDAGRAFELGPDQSETYKVLGVIYALSGNYRQALLNYDEAIARAPDDSAIYNDRGYTQFLKGDTVSAVLDYNTALTLDPAVITLNNRADSYFKMGLCALADQDYQTAIEFASGSLTASDIISTTSASETAIDTIVRLPDCIIRLNGPTDAHSAPSVTAPVLHTINFGPLTGTAQALGDGILWLQLAGDSWLRADQVDAEGDCEDLPFIDQENTPPEDTQAEASPTPVVSEIQPVESCIVDIAANVSLFAEPDPNATLIKTLANAIGTTAVAQHTDEEGTIWLQLVTDEWVRLDDTVPLPTTPCAGLPNAGIEITTAQSSPDSATPAPSQQVSICNVRTSNTVNLRSGPGTNFERQGTLAAGSSTPATGQAMGLDGEVWWQLEDESWVRSDVVTEEGRCEDLPTLTVP